MGLVWLDTFILVGIFMGFQMEYFHDEGVKTLNYLDSLFQWDNLQKSKFYKGLSEILPGLPHRVRLLRY
jgi:SCY1-like protein 2